MSRRHHVVIIGGGFSGTALAVQLLRCGDTRREITLIESGERLGRGIAYGTTLDAHVLNTRAGRMSLLPDGPQHFVSWLRRRGDGAISAVRDFHFDANNDQEQPRFYIRRTGPLVDTRQVSQEFRVTASPFGRLDYQAGVHLFDIETESTSRNLNGADAGAFFASNAQYAALTTEHGRALLQESLDGVLVTTHQNPETDSIALFGQADWH
jgi:hypothetical protein